MSRVSLSLCAALLMAAPAWSDSPIRPGDRIAFVGNTFADQLRIHGYLETLLLQRSAGEPVSIRNLGWAGDMLTARDRPTNFPTEESTLRAHKTDVIIACFGMGESFAGEAGCEGFKRDLEDFIASHQGKKYNGHSEVRLVFISPIAYEDHGATTPNWERRNEELVAYTEVMGEVASKAGLPFVDLNGPTSRLMADSSAPRMTGNGVNLNGYGYWCVSRTVADALLPGPPPWRLSVDAKSATASATGVDISHVEQVGPDLRFTVEEITWPGLGPPVDGKLHQLVEGHRDRLIVSHLADGDYQLTIDGEPIVTARASHWSEGVPIDNSPAHRDLEKYRSLIYDKNINFVYSWKALNQVHIVGERRQSPSGRALPGELIEFNRIANEMDAALADGIELKTREWRLTLISPIENSDDRR